ncbi:DUF1010 domain-containing protein [Pseudomonas aeruginosa]
MLASQAPPAIRLAALRRFPGPRFFVGCALVQVRALPLAFGSNPAFKPTRILRTAYLGR